MTIMNKYFDDDKKEDYNEDEKEETYINYDVVDGKGNQMEDEKKENILTTMPSMVKAPK